MHSLLLFVVLAFTFTSCSSSAPPEPDPEFVENPAITPKEYTGLPLQTRMEAEELIIKATVPTGGFKFLLRETSRVDGHTEVKLTLEAPGKEEAVTQAIETKELRVRMPAEDGAVHVKLQECERGLQYFVEPTFEVAKILTR